MTIYLVEKRSGLTRGGYAAVCAFRDKRNATQLADSYGQDEEWTPYGRVRTIDLADDVREK